MKVTLPSHNHLTHRKMFLKASVVHAGYKYPLDDLELVKNKIISLLEFSRTNGLQSYRLPLHS